MDAAGSLLVLSNRGPISFVRDAAGTVRARRGAGGLIVTVGPGAERDKALWLAAASTEEDREGARRGQVTTGGFRFVPVVVDRSDYSAYYDVVANQTLWFCLHGLWDRPRRPRFDRHWWAAWERYRSVNEAFAAAADSAAVEGATVLVQDYHLALVPAALTRRRPDLSVAAFVHTPWCSPDELGVLPDAVSTEIVAGLGGGASCGFHTVKWAERFAECGREMLGSEPATFVAPAAPDAEDLLSVARSERCAAAVERLRTLTGGRRLIVRVDRIEPSKNVLRGFWAFDELLETRPDLRGEVIFAAMIYPSRAGLAEYQAYRQEVMTLANQLNEKWATPGWDPILVDSKDNYPASVAALRCYDVLLVNPVRDGLNLVAKEGPLVNERDGVLVLSHQAGAWEELGAHSVGLNPFDVSGTAAALGAALDMPSSERATRAARLRSKAGARSPLDWFDDLLAHGGGTSRSRAATG